MAEDVLNAKAEEYGSMCSEEWMEEVVDGCSILRCEIEVHFKPVGRPVFRRDGGVGVAEQRCDADSA